MYDLSGIILGVSKELEWMLPWWFHHYNRTNSLPVAVVDFGLTPLGAEFAREKAILIQPELQTSFVKDKKYVSKFAAMSWESAVEGDLWEIRKKWLLKPQAMLNTPFEKTIWIDIDCQINTSLEEVMKNFPKDREKILISAESIVGQQFYHYYGIEDTKVYNSGVVGYYRNSKIINDWNQLCLKENQRFFGDQNALSHLINKNPSCCVELDRKYNFNPFAEEISDPLIIHWVGGRGKQKILEMMKDFP